MKRRVWAAASAAMMATTAFGAQAVLADKYPNGQVKVFNWGEYIDEDLIDEFEDEYGIEVIYDTFDTNEAMYPRVEADPSLYDVICPSDYMIEKMIQNDVPLAHEGVSGSPPHGLPATQKLCRIIIESRHRTQFEGIEPSDHLRQVGIPIRVSGGTHSGKRRVNGSFQSIHRRCYRSDLVVDTRYETRYQIFTYRLQIGEHIQ